MRGCCLSVCLFFIIKKKELCDDVCVGVFVCVCVCLCACVCLKKTWGCVFRDCVWCLFVFACCDYVFVCDVEAVCLDCELLCDVARHGCVLFFVLVCVYVCIPKVCAFFVNMLCDVVWLVVGVFLCLWMAVCGLLNLSVWCVCDVLCDGV